MVCMQMGTCIEKVALKCSICLVLAVKSSSFISGRRFINSFFMAINNELASAGSLGFLLTEVDFTSRVLYAVSVA